MWHLRSIQEPFFSFRVLGFLGLGLRIEGLGFT